MALRIALACVIAGLSLLQHPSALAQSAYPSRPIRIAITTNAGGMLDILARLFADRLRERLKQPIIVESKPGGGSLVAVDYLLKQPADGYTLLFNSVSMTTLPYLNPNATYDPAKDFVPVAPFVQTFQTLAVASELPIRNLADFVAYARANPGKLNFGVSTPASIDHLSVELLMQRAGFQMTVIPYKGEPQAVLDLLAGRTQAQMMGYSVLQPNILSGKLRPIAGTSLTRNPSLPDVPTMAEQGYSGLGVTIWLGLFAVAGVPADSVSLINRSVNEAQADPDILARLKELGVSPLSLSPEAFRDLVRQDSERWGKVIR
jgi:tripartite-type tricarboxylate transporter receptor subunit TctC